MTDTKDYLKLRERAAHKWIPRFEELKKDAINSGCNVYTFTRDQYMDKFKVSEPVANNDIRRMLIFGVIEEPRHRKGRYRVIC